MNDIIHTERGGIRFGYQDDWFFQLNLTWPFVKLTATPSGIRISMRLLGLRRKEFTFAKSELQSIRRKCGILPFSTGIVLAHQNPDYPRFILFWTFNYQKLKTELTQLGFTVEDQ